MLSDIRKFVAFDEEIHIEGQRAATPPLRMMAIMAVLKNPWGGADFTADLTPEIQRIAPDLGAMMTARIAALAGGADKIEAYGKAAIVGVNGEIEHGSALIHTLRFGNHYRQAVGAKTFLAFTNTRGPANTQIQIPLMDINEAGRRSHYLTVQCAVYDAPGPDEIVIALGAASGGRPHHRIGDRYADLAAMGHDVDNPAGV
jgi:hypothetical protein